MRHVYHVDKHAYGARLWWIEERNQPYDDNPVLLPTLDGGSISVYSHHVDLNWTVDRALVHHLSVDDELRDEGAEIESVIV